MQSIRSIKRMQSTARRIVADGRTIGLVPTMGYLHDGHLSLVAKAKKAADFVIATIFVNPAQFSASEDLSTYPRDEKGDLKKLREAGTDIVFMPDSASMYPDEFQTYVSVDKLTQGLEGKSRPTHFRGVTTVVTKLFNIVRPDVAVFGMKDFQQAAVLKQMVRDLAFPIKMIVAPTMRERDGLAMSSRNRYLNEAQRWEAVCLYYALRSAKAMVKSGITDAAKIKREMLSVIKATCPSAMIDYIAFNDLDSLVRCSRVTRNTVCSLAVKVHGIRLIDNMKLA
jgi:pantoate--beta-alanine ligase